MLLTRNTPINTPQGWVPSGVIQTGSIEVGEIRIVAFNALEHLEKPIFFTTEDEAKRWLEENYSQLI